MPSAYAQNLKAVERGAPPSTYYALDVAEGAPNAIPRMVSATLARSTFFLPGLLAIGYRGTPLIKTALAASSSLSVILLLYYGYQHKASQASGTAAPWDKWGR
jgi:hypothetical protein